MLRPVPMWPPEIRIEDALRECTRKAVEYALQHPDASLGIDVVNRRVRIAVLKALGRLKLVTATLNGLPPSVVDRILDLLDFNSRSAMSQTCHSLRLACQRVFQLRAVEHNPDPKRTTWQDVLARLAQTDPTPVIATYTHDLERLPSHAEKLYSTTLSRARSLTLRPQGNAVFNRKLPRAVSFQHLVFNQEVFHIVSRPGERAWIDYSRLLCYPAPHLRSFQLVAHVPVFHGFPAVTLLVPPRIFAGQTASLINCLLHGVTLPVGGCRAFAYLTLLDYSPSGGVLYASELADVLHSLPRLVTLGLALHAFHGSSSRKQLAHRSLKHVAVRYMRSKRDTTSNRRLILFFQKHQLEEFIIDLREDKLYSARSLYLGWRTATQPPISSIEKYLPPAAVLTAVDNCAVVQGENYRLAVPLDAFRLHDDEVLFANLQSLTISADHWLCADPKVPSGPMITSLCLIFMPHHWREWTWDLWHWAPETPPERPWACPNLQQLEIACLPPAKDDDTVLSIIHGRWLRAASRFTQPISIALEGVQDFVRGGLRYDARRLQRIVLSGVGAVADLDPAAAFAGLQQLAEEVEVTPVVSARVVQLHQKATAPPGHDHAFR